MKNKGCCPKCGAKLRPTYMKQNCPSCGANLLYYKMDERLEADAIKAQQEVDKVHHFLMILKNSCIKTPLHIVRLVLFFLPLATMCLPMYWAGHKNVSLITFVMSIINHGFDLGAMAGDLSYLFAVLAMVMIIVLSLVVIIASCFSCTKRGFRRNEVLSLINTTVFGVLSILVCTNGGMVKAGFFATMALYAIDFAMHLVVADTKTKKRKITTAISVCLSVALAVTCLCLPKPARVVEDFAGDDSNIRVVSFNLACAFGTKLEDTDSFDRCRRFSQYINQVSPDLIGTQELNVFWFDMLNIQGLGGYESYAVERGGDSEPKNSEMNGIFWKTDVFDLVDKNTFWLSATPDEESKYTYIDENGEEAEAGCNRICTYAVLKEKSSDRLVLFMNTHLDNSSEEARCFGAGVILDRITQLKAQYGEDICVILSGDFNESEGEALDDIKAVLNDTTAYNNTKATYQEWGYRSTGDMPIDFIFTNGDSENYRVLDNVSGGYVSDHYGIMTDIIM